MARLSKRAAQALLDSIRTDLLHVEENIVKFIRARGWEPLGFDTFIEAWNANMKGVRLSTDALKAHVVFAMFEDGLSDEEIIRATGVGDATVGRMRERKADGIDPKYVSVRPHTKSYPEPSKSIRLEFDTHEEKKYWEDLCDAKGRNLHELCLRASRAELKRLERARASAA